MLHRNEVQRGFGLVDLALVALLLTTGFAAMGSGDRAEAETALIATGQSDQTVRAANTARRAVSAAELHALITDPSIRDFKGLAENDWDFNDPLGVPGFGTIPSIASEYPVIWR